MRACGGAAAGWTRALPPRTDARREDAGAARDEARTDDRREGRSDASSGDGATTPKTVHAGGRGSAGGTSSDRPGDAQVGGLRARPPAQKDEEDDKNFEVSPDADDSGGEEKPLQRLVKVLTPQLAAAVWPLDCGASEDIFGGAELEKPVEDATAAIATAGGAVKPAASSAAAVRSGWALSRPISAATRSAS